MIFSLRLRLFTLVTFAVALATVPAALYSHRTLGDVALDFERRNFDTMVMLVEDRLKTGYMNLLYRETQDVMRQKYMLRNIAKLSREIWEDLRSDSSVLERSEVAHKLNTALNERRVHSEMYDAKGGFMLDDPLFKQLGENLEQIDFKGDTLADLLTYARLPEEGVYAVFRLLAPNGRHRPMLIYFMPHPQAQLVVCLGIPLGEGNTEISKRNVFLLEDVRSQLNTMNLHGIGAVSIFSDTRRLLATTRDSMSYSEDCIPESIFVEAKNGRLAEYVETVHSHIHSSGVHDEDFDGAYYRVAYFKEMEWYMVAGIPQTTIEEPAAALAEGIGFVALCSGIISLLGTLFVASRLTTPIRILTAKALELARRDFSSTKQFSARTLFGDEREKRDLLKRSDEVGQLAGAFVNMDKELCENIENLVVMTTAKERLEGELNAARDIQRGILPPPEALQIVEGVRVTAMLEPAREVGGDLYDTFPLRDGRQAVVIGDVSGKGVPAALFMAMTVVLLRYTLDGDLDIQTVMMRINERLAVKNPENMFVTLFIGVYDPANGRLDFVNAGHCSPFIVGPRGIRALDYVSGPPVGSFVETNYTASYTVLQPDEYGFIYSDGVTEAMNERNDLFGEAHLREILTGLSPETAMSLLREVLVDWRGTAEQSDDIAMLIFGSKAQS